MAKKDIEIQPGFESGSSEFWSDALTNELLFALACMLHFQLLLSFKNSILYTLFSYLDYSYIG